MSSAWGTVSTLSKKKFVRYGVPFMVMVVGGSFVLKEFAQLRYTFSKKQKLTRKDMEELGLEIKEKQAVSLETAYEEIKKMDIDNWHNIRGPRPWEEPAPELVAMKSKSKS
ncbi:hypothetical protein R5R35_013180 [Gryllus longicercus]|uniref:Cytochrome c oxidase assembly protein COX16 homolog, mitochondrial n=1 Tax=Gryllus longicercus TaxID=2509291 RepID=A0AAN9Z2U4_9ORTH